MFEITVLDRDSQGNVIYNAEGVPKVKSFKGETGFKLWEFWNRNGTHLRRKVKAAKAGEAQSILEEVNTSYAAKVKKKKRVVEDDE